MKKKASLYHVTWYIAIALAVVLAIFGSGYWYIPIVVYLAGATVSIVIIAVFRGKVAKLPYYAKKAFQMTIKK